MSIHCVWVLCTCFSNHIQHFSSVKAVLPIRLAATLLPGQKQHYRLHCSVNMHGTATSVTGELVVLLYSQHSQPYHHCTVSASEHSRAVVDDLGCQCSSSSSDGGNGGSNSSSRSGSGNGCSNSSSRSSSSSSSRVMCRLHTHNPLTRTGCDPKSMSWWALLCTEAIASVGPGVVRPAVLSPWDHRESADC